MVNREDIIRMAREAGWTSYDSLDERFERFAALVAAAAKAEEREACAEVAREFRRGAGEPVCAEVAAAIRARGKA